MFAVTVFFRSSHQRSSIKRAVLKKLRNIHRKTSVLVSPFNKVAGLLALKNICEPLLQTAQTDKQLAIFSANICQWKFTWISKIGNQVSKFKGIIAHNKFQKNQRKYALLVTSYCCVLLIISFSIGVINFEINLSYLIKTFSKM